MSSFYELESHPDKPLYIHLKKVGKRCREIVNSKYLNLSKFFDKEILENISYVIGACHDIAKATSYFQRYIKEKDENRKRKLKADPRTNHGLLSAIFTYYATKKFLECEYPTYKENRYLRYMPIISYIVVKKHHGDLRNARDELNIGERLDILYEQLDSINDNIVNQILSELSIYANFSEFKECFEDIIKKIKIDESIKLLPNKIKDDGMFYYFILIFLYSILTDADKSDATDVLNEIPDRKVDIPDDLVDIYKIKKFSRKPKDKISEIRDSIYNDVISVKDISLENKIYSLNVPTGTGKTLTSLSFALKLRRKISKDNGFTPKIIYSLPFISIIDQNHSVFENVLRLYKKEVTSDILLKYHHLSDVFYKIQKEDSEEYVEPELDKSIILTEGWNSEIIVTSFIQFFHGIISNKNRSLRKFHNIVNSIVLLDEVQAIPHKYWSLLNKVLKFLADVFNVYFVFITATQPLIFNEEKKEIISLVDNRDKYFKKLRRIKAEIKISDEITLKKFKDVVFGYIKKNINKNFLIVLNTINSSKEVYEFLRNNLDDDMYDFFYLSTNIIPLQRQERIKKIKQKGNKKKIIVSTQVVEAGVDIDVDVVYRDISPLDSINQVAGRCNRNYKDNLGIVKVFAIIDERNRNKKFSSYIYDPFLISKTIHILKSKKAITEDKFLELNNEYFKKVSEGMSHDISKSLLEILSELKFSEIPMQFKLIEEDYDKIDIFVEFDANAKNIWKEYKNILKTRNILDRKRQFMKIRKDFYNYVISVQYNKLKKSPELFSEKFGIGYLSYESLEEYYHPEIGFKPRDGILLF